MTEALKQSEQDPGQESSPALIEKAVSVVGKSWVEIARAPVSLEKPSGQNVRLDDLFEKIEAEIAKLDSLTDDSPVEWNMMAQWCQDILTHQSKDILAACYLARALCETNLLQGLVKATLLNFILAETYWDDCFPPRKRTRGRSAAYNWWIEQCAPLVEKSNFNVGNIETLDLLIGMLESLDVFLLERLEEEAPGFNELLQPLRRQRAALAAQKRSQEKKREQANVTQSHFTAAPGEKTGESPQPPQSLVGKINSDRDLQNCYRSVQDALRNACEYLRADSLASSEAFRVNRFLTWLAVVQLPPATNGVTQIRPPSKEKLQHYRSLEASGDYKTLVPELEVSLSKAPYWLDGHRIVHGALLELGYTESADTVMAGVRDFVMRFPGVSELKFSDQSDFADTRTKQWLQMEVLRGAESTMNNTLPVTGAESHAWEDAYQQAMQMFREKKRAEAFALFRDGCRQAFSQRSLAFWRYYQARFCFETQQLDLAIALLESIEQTLQNKGFEEWEPEISAKVIELLIRAYQQQAENEIPRNRVAALHEKLCQFDLATAYELSIN